MKRNSICLALAILLALVAFPGFVSAQGAQDDEERLNVIRLDLTINPDDGGVSIGGYTPEELRSLGLLPYLNADAINIIRRFDSARIRVDQEGGIVELDDEQLAILEWDDESRRNLVRAAAASGVMVDEETVERIESWINTSEIEVTARVSGERSTTPVVSVRRPIQVSVGEEGEVTVERVPLINRASPMLLDMARRGNINNMVVCWDRGSLVTTINGSALPQFTVKPEGLALLNEALGDTLTFDITEENIDLVTSAQLGVEVTLPGGTTQEDVQCGSDE